MNWTKPGELPRTCSLFNRGRQVEVSRTAESDRDIAWLSEHVNNRDWYAVERLAKRLQENDNIRAFDAVDLINNL